MLPSLSSSNLTKLRRIFLLVLFIAGCAFYYAQNAGLLVGGKIAFEKLLWLSAAIIYFYLLPLVVFLDRRIVYQMRFVMALFFANMVLRGVVELFMIYVFLNWSPIIGIAHDAISLLFMIGSLLYLSKFFKEFGYLAIIGTTLTMIFELCFAIFFHIFIAPNKTTGENAIYFVASDTVHGFILNISLTAVIILCCLWYLLSRRSAACPSYQA